jgi:hypothetical protein
VGGQQRICTATRKNPVNTLPLPRGLTHGFSGSGNQWRVKWVLLSPAIFPEIIPGKDRQGSPQPGGWLPNWICSQSGKVLLKNINAERDPGKESREQWRQRVQNMPPIQAKLVAAIIPKPMVVTGWSLPKPDRPSSENAKPTHLAVPAGAIYYFEAQTRQEAEALAAALNWHGSNTHSQSIQNRRSTLLGEQGYGIGVVVTWDFYSKPK